MNFELATMARGQRSIRRKAVVLREVNAPMATAADLYVAAYRPVINLWADAAPGIVAEYERSLAEFTGDSAADLEGVVGHVDQAAGVLVTQLAHPVRRWLERVEQIVRHRWRGAVLSATGVDIENLMAPDDVREVLEAVLQRNVTLIRDVSAQARSRVSDAVFRGLTQRRPSRDVARDIREVVTMGRNRSLRIASHQLSALSSALVESRQLQAGIKQVVWASSHKANPRPAHAARHGKRFYLHTKKAVDGSETVDPSDWVGVPPYCGCRSRSYIEFTPQGADDD